MENNKSFSSIPKWVWALGIILTLLVVAIMISPSSPPSHKTVQEIPPITGPEVTAEPFTDPDLFVAAWREAGTKQDIMAKGARNNKLIQISFPLD